MMKDIHIGFSPCPNDTYIFDALVNKKIPTGEFNFIPVMEDVETLNRWALEGKLEITKLSYGCMAPVMDRYSILDAGSALGVGVGPLLIGKEPYFEQAINEIPIAIPGSNTTAHMLFTLAFPEARNKVFLRYDAVEDFVLQNLGAGVIIHENRFTYRSKGLHLWFDLGDFWEKQYKVPVPLGGIAAKKSLGDDGKKLSDLIRKSIDYSSNNHNKNLSDYVKNHAMEMEEEVMRKHIDLYVNDYSISLGEDGRSAVKVLLKQYAAVHPGEYAEPEFL